MTMSIMNVDKIVNVNVTISPSVTAKNTFGTGLILGKSARIPKEERIRRYRALSEMLEDHFAATDPEYLAATAYFAQRLRPEYVYIGGISTGETVIDALEDCMNHDSAWYGVYICGADKADIPSVVKWMDGMNLTLFYGTNESDALDASSDSDILSAVKKLNVNNGFGIYSADEYTPAAVMGLAMGMNDGSDGSAFAMAYKGLNGIEPDRLTNDQISAIKGKNGNVYIARVGGYRLIEQGVSCDGTPFDEVLGLHQLAGEIQSAVMDLLSSARVRKIPYTDEGTLQIVTAVASACARARSRGFITPGVWEADPVLELNTGDAMSEGYYVAAEPVGTQNADDRKNRIAPPIYVCIKLAGAIEFAVINVTVER